MGARRSRIPKETQIAIAQALADGAKLQKDIAAEHGINFDYFRQIARGDKVPEIRAMADALTEEYVKSAMTLAKRQARLAVANLSVMARNAPVPAPTPTDKSATKIPYDHNLQRAACNDIIDLAFRDVAEANTSHLNVSGGVVLLADVIKARNEVPADRAAALGLIAVAGGSLPGGNGHAAPHRLSGSNGDGNGHSDGNGHGTPESTDTQ